MTVILVVFSLACIGYIAYLHSRNGSHRDSIRARAIEAIIETTRYGVIETDVNGIILICNPAAEKKERLKPGNGLIFARENEGRSRIENIFDGLHEFLFCNLYSCSVPRCAH